MNQRLLNQYYELIFAIINEILIVPLNVFKNYKEQLLANLHTIGIFAVIT